MRIDSYVYKSRHGIFYFRWPLPTAAGQTSRATLRLSLGVRCPKQAGDLARYLASCGAMLKGREALGEMRYDELRSRVKEFYSSSLEQFKTRISESGPPSAMEEHRLTEARLAAESPPDIFWDWVAPDGTDALLGRFCESSGFPVADAKAEPVLLLQEIKNAYLGLLQAREEYQASLSKYDFSETRHPANETASAPIAPQKPSVPLQQAIDEYIAENRNAKSWGVTTHDKKLAHLSTLVEVLNGDRQTRSISDQDVLDVKRVIAALPKNRQKMPATRGLSILDAIAVERTTKIDAVTLNGYLSTFHSFFDWVVKNKYANENLFKGMKVGTAASKKQPQRKPFKPDALKAMHIELTHNHMGMVKSGSHKWATLIAMFTGARLNEICQLEIADVQQENGIWFFNMTDEGDNNKRLKTFASNRKVPIHSQLLEDGLLQYHKEMAQTKATRLFPDYSYEARGGYGRSLGRWFNDVFLVKQHIKTKELVFHSLRHTMITRLAQAGVQEPIYQCIVGHERNGVTQQVYNREGFTLPQVKEAIELFSL